MDLGVGETEINLIGTQEDYRVSVSKGIGDAKVDGKDISNDAVVGNGESRVEISGGIGSVRVRFVSEESEAKNG